MNEDIKRSIILEHYRNPINRGLSDDASYIKVNMNNESCVDEIDLQVKLDGDVIKDIRFDGEACAISTSSTSIMIELLIDKTLNEAKDIYENFENMIDEKEYNEGLLDSANVYNDIYRQPSRKKCALLPWWGIKKILDEKEDN